MTLSPELALAGAVVGVFVGLTGMGGGALMTPILVVIFGVDPTAAVGSDLLASVAMKPVGAAVHQRAGTVRWELVRWLAPGAVPSGFAAALLLHAFGSGAVLEHRVQLAVGAALLLAVAGILARAMFDARDARHGALAPTDPLAVKRVRTLMIGVVGGLVVGLTSVGSGSLIIAMLMLSHPRLRPGDLVGTDLAQAVPLVGAAALGHLVAGDVRIALTGSLLLGALPGIYLGAKLSARAPAELLRWLLAVLLLASGLTLWGAGTPLTVGACAMLLLPALVAAVRSRRLPAVVPARLNG